MVVDRIGSYSGSISKVSSELTEAEKKQLEKLKKRDQQVRAHEQAHIAAGGSYVRGAHFEYQKGPDGNLYAVGGEVSIDISPIPNNPEGTIKKMQIVRQAALAPADPSPQDYRVASYAQMEITKAQIELLRMKRKDLDYQGHSQPRDNILSLVV